MLNTKTLGIQPSNGEMFVRHGTPLLGRQSGNSRHFHKPGENRNWSFFPLN